MITNYTTLQSTIADYLARSDLTSQIPLFIQLAENRLRRDLRIRPMLKVVTTTTTAGDPTVSMPSDFLEMPKLEQEQQVILITILQWVQSFNLHLFQMQNTHLKWSIMQHQTI